MTPTDFIGKMETYFEKELAPGQVADYADMLNRFTDGQLTELYFALLQTCGFFPKIRDVYDAAKQRGYLNTPTDWTARELERARMTMLMARQGKL